MWKAIPGFSLYEASEDGKIRRIAYDAKRGPRRETPFELRQHINKNGYKIVSIKPDGKRQVNHLVHQLVAKTFHGEQSGKFVCHKDGDKFNNAANNLYWGTPADNARDAVRHGSFDGRWRNDRHPTAKLSEKDVRQIRRDIEIGWKVSVLAKHYEVSESTISMIKSGANWGWLQ